MSETKIIYEGESFERMHRTCLGSSAIAAIAGVSRWKTALEVWGYMTGKLAAIEENDAMWLGTQIQPILGQLFTRRTRFSVKANAFSFHHPKFPWAVATPDFFVFDGATVISALETKNTGAFARQVWEEGLPDEAHAQVTWQLGILKQYPEYAHIEKAFVAALVGGSVRDFHIKEIPFSQSLFDTLLELGEKFMTEYVKKDIAPEITADDTETINALTSHPSKHIDLSGDAYLCAQIEDYKELKKMRGQIETRQKELGAKLKEIENTVRFKLNGFDSAQFGKTKVALKTVERGAYEVKATSYIQFKLIEDKENGTETDAIK